MPTVLINRSYKTTEEPGCAIVERREIDWCPSTSDRFGVRMSIVVKTVFVEGDHRALASQTDEHRWTSGKPEENL